MTEDEAKTKWCPFVRHEGDEGGTFNRGGYDSNPINASVHKSTAGRYRCHCIGSACMAWRWDYAGTVITFDGMISVEQLERMKRQATPQHGFCGLANKP